MDVSLSLPPSLSVSLSPSENAAMTKPLIIVCQECKVSMTGPVAVFLTKHTLSGWSLALLMSCVTELADAQTPIITTDINGSTALITREYQHRNVISFVVQSCSFMRKFSQVPYKYKNRSVLLPLVGLKYKLSTCGYGQILVAVKGSLLQGRCRLEYSFACFACCHEFLPFQFIQLHFPHTLFQHTATFVANSESDI